MLQKTAVKDLKVGLFVADLDRPWMDTPFLLQGFMLENPQQIGEVRAHRQWVPIDPMRSVRPEFEQKPKKKEPPQKRDLGTDPIVLVNRTAAPKPLTIDNLRAADRAVAVSEDKIVILPPNLKRATRAWLAAGKVQRTLEASYTVDGQRVAIRPVAGIATFPEHAELAEELIVHSDISLGITNQRDLAQHVQTKNRRDSDVYLGLEAPLREAVRTNQLELHFQPQIDIPTGKAVSAEALLSWNAPDFGMVSPATIIRIAEASGIVGELTAWVINTALRQQADWLKRGILVKLSLNLSTLNLTNGELPDTVQQALGTWNTDPSSITFEITASATVGDSVRSAEILIRLKELGVKLAIDDFGTDYSSLSYLENFPLDELKIDKLFMQELMSSAADQKFVKSVTALSHDFGMKVVAEGVEDDATFRELKKLGCDLAQGYAYSPALPANSFIDWFQKHR
jgi:EAL domain-containing protein (putative c-di-GMP-specific phosphodiesterase class I)